MRVDDNEPFSDRLKEPFEGDVDECFVDVVQSFQDLVQPLQRPSPLPRLQSARNMLRSYLDSYVSRNTQKRIQYMAERKIVL